MYTSFTTHERVKKALKTASSVLALVFGLNGSRIGTTFAVTGPLLSAALPGFAAELESGLRDAGRPELADQVASLRIREVCRCDVEGCASFYTAAPMRRWFRRGKQVPVGELVV